MNKFLSTALFVNLLVSPFHVVASDEDANAVYVSSPNVIDRGLGTTSFLSDNSAQSATKRMLYSLKGTKNFTPLDDKKQTSQKSNNRQEPHVERNMSTQKFLTKSDLQTAVNQYCSNPPSEWVDHPDYDKYGPITDWDVSLITDMSYLFSTKSTCNPDIASWDVSAVTDFTAMFYEANAFNQDIGSWDVSKGVKFDRMFHSAKVFNQDIGSWDVSNGVTFYVMFGDASAFNQDIGSWDVSKCLNFQAMFANAIAFNQDIGSWDVSNGLYFDHMFYQANAFNQDIGSWDVSKGVKFSSMFSEAKSFNQDIGSWDVSKGVTFDHMFLSAIVFNQDIGSWDVSKGVNFDHMFLSAKVFNQDIGSWDVSNGVTFQNMFRGASEFRQNLCGWDISPTSTNYDFCTGSYCGGDCSPTSEPTSAPSKIPSDVPSPIPTVNPTGVFVLCNVDDVFAQTLFLPGAGACWRVQLAAGGTMEGDFTDESCSKTESKWQSTNGVFSLFSSISVLDETAVFIPGTNGYSGTFQFVEDPTVTQASPQLLSWDETAKVFAVEVTIPTCATDAICPTMKIEL